MIEYCRCSVFDKNKVLKNISFPAYLQLKCDGSYREAQVVQNTSVRFFSRAGKEYSNPILEKEMLSLPSGSYYGEWTIGPADSPSENRFKGNGDLNSLNPPYSLVIYTIWDFNDLSNTNVPYDQRFRAMLNLEQDRPHIKIVPSYEVNSLEEALTKTREFMVKGLEGGILKDFSYTFKNGTSNKQYKIKLQLECDMRITGFTEGTGKRANYFGAIQFSNDEGTISGSCSGFSDSLMKKMNQNRESYIGKVISVEFNDLIHQGNKYTLNHPRFLTIREDKTSTDSLERVKEIKNMTLSI